MKHNQEDFQTSSNMHLFILCHLPSKACIQFKDQTSGAT